MKKSKKELVSLVISQTLIFIVIVLMVGILKSIFGPENSMLGVTSIVLMLVLSSLDLTVNPVKNLISLIIINLILGLSAFLSAQYLFIGLILNFLIMLFIGYYFTYELKKPVNMLIGLHYMLLLTYPVTVLQLPRRIVLLTFGAFIIIGFQMLANKNKLIKSRKKSFDTIIDALLLKVDLLKSNKNTKEADIILVETINKLKSTIFDNGKSDSHLTECGSNTINILSSLEKIDTILDNLKNKSLDYSFLDEISTVLKDIKDNKSNIAISKFEDNYKNSDISDLIDIYDFIAAVKVFNSEIKNFNSTSNKQQNPKKELSIPDEFMKLHVKKNFISLKNTRVAYGLRLGLMFAITFFIVRLFDIKHGEWAAYTVFALIQPHLEFTVTKSKKRIFGTILGALIVGVFFSLTDDPTLRMLLLIFSGYCMSYISDYKYLAICITIAAIASAAVSVPNANPVIISRVVLVIIGIVLAVIANHIVFPRRLIDEEENLNNIQKQSSRKMIGEVLLNEGSENASVIGILSLVPSLIELRTQYLVKNGLNMDMSLISKNKILMNDLLQIYLLTKDDTEYSKLLNKIKSITSTSNSIDIIQSKITESIASVNNIKEKFLLVKVEKILTDIHHLDYNEKEQSDLYEFLTIFS